MVSEKDVIEAFNKGKKSGAATARNKAKSDKPAKRRKKYYKIKNPWKVAKQGIGKFQSKHPVVSSGAAAIVAIPILDRVIYSATRQSLSQATGLNAGKLPGFYPIRNLTGLIFQRVGRLFR